MIIKRIYISAEIIVFNNGNYRTYNNRVRTGVITCRYFETILFVPDNDRYFLSRNKRAREKLTLVSIRLLLHQHGILTSYKQYRNVRFLEIINDYSKD